MRKDLVRLMYMITLCGPTVGGDNITEVWAVAEETYLFLREKLLVAPPFSVALLSCDGKILTHRIGEGDGDGEHC